MKSKAKEILNQKVAQGNDLVRYGRYDLTAVQRKILYTLIAMVKPEDLADTGYTITFNDLCEVLGYDKSGLMYDEIRKDLKMLRDRSHWIKRPDGKKETISWLSSVIIDENNSKVTVFFHQTIHPYLFDLWERGNFTSFYLDTAISFSSKYSADLHELLLSYSYKSSLGKPTFVDFTIEELKERLGVFYDRWYDIKKHVIDKACEEISVYSEKIKVEYKTDTPRKPKSIIFTVYKKGMIEELKARESAKKETLKEKKKPGRPKKKEKTEEERKLEFLNQTINLTFEEAKNIFDVSKMIQEGIETHEKVMLTDEQKELLESASKKMVEIKDEEIEKIQKEIRKGEREAKRLEKMPDSEEKEELIRQNNIDLENKRMILEKYKKLDEKVEKN